MLRRAGILAPRAQWILGVRALGERRFDDPSGFRPVVPPKDRFYADPFIVGDESGRYILIEEFVYARGRGVISVMTIDDTGAISSPAPVLERPYHLSYPFVFREGTEYFLIPETAATSSVELYRAVEFPYRWTHERTLLENIPARDSTLFFHEGRYWLFTCLWDRPAINNELSIFSAPSLEGRWLPHPTNPVVRDARCARPAGRLFWREGELLRPAQDCSTRYGQAVTFQRVVELTPSTYREAPAGRLEPVWTPGLVGAHTYNADERFELIDGQRPAGR